MKIKIFTGPDNYDISSLYIKEDSEYIIGVDKGAIMLLEKGINIDMAIGDFDSINEKENSLLKETVKNIKKFSIDKDYTDTYLAVKEALKLNYDEIIIYGGIGQRVDHMLGNIALLKLGDITMLNNNTKMYILDPGEYEISGKYDYISFFAVEDVINLMLEGFKYTLKNYDLLIDDPLCISNKGNGQVSFEAGTLLVVEEKE